MELFIKELLRRIPNWAYIAGCSFIAGAVCAVILTGKTVTWAGEPYGIALDELDGNGTKRLIVDATSTDHSNDEETDGSGRYFNFEANQLSDALGTTAWEIVTLPGMNLDTGEVGLMTMWQGTNGGSTGTAHGRFSDWSISNGQFEAGHRIELVIPPTDE